MYTDLGFGYNIAKSNSNIQFDGFPATKGYDSYSGLGCHLSLGGSYKLKSGKIYLEAMWGGIIKGTFKRSVPFPDGYPIYLGGFSYTKTNILYFDLLGLNLGYCF